ncbi:MAG: ribulose-phosphate 3-epimerase [Bacteroidota bacterium]|nr:ribulose-phosphate 3-epimerase [Bacteroidota bacterium]
MRKDKIVLPSILAANFAHLEDAITQVTKAGATMLHLDIMDGHFVPNISFGSGTVKQINSFCSLTLDTHLMIEDPDKYLEDFCNAGSDILTVHVEACRHLHRTVSKIKELGMKAGVSLNPATSLISIEEILPMVDLVLVMSVNPGFGGQKFIESSIDRVERLSALINEKKLHTVIEVDGGIDATTIVKAKNAGADYFVAGNAVFGNGKIENNFKQLLQLLH